MAYEFLARGEIDDCIENPPKIPSIFEKVWDWFLSLQASRQGDNAISFSDMRAFFDMVNEQPSKWELSIIQQLDSQFLQLRYEHNKE